MTENGVVERLTKLEGQMAEQAATLAGIKADIRHLADGMARIASFQEWASGEKALARTRDDRLDRLDKDMESLRSQIGSLQAMAQQFKGIAIMLGIIWPVVFWAIQRFLFA